MFASSARRQNRRRCPADAGRMIISRMIGDYADAADAGATDARHTRCGDAYRLAARVTATAENVVASAQYGAAMAADAFIDASCTLRDV